jgi:vacuolar-type H+-ATPase subunit H
MKTEQTLKEMQDELEKETIATQKYILQNGKDKVSEILTKYLKNLGQDIQKLTNEIGNKTDNVALYKLHCKNIYCEM